MTIRPSLVPATNFNPHADAQVLRIAMKGIGCSKNKVIAVVCGRTNMQRQQIAMAFAAMYRRDLYNDLRSELSGNFQYLILTLMEPPGKYDAMQLRRAMAGVGTRESILVEILTTRLNAQILDIKRWYIILYRSDLEQDLISETSGHFKRLLMALCAAGRDETCRVDPPAAMRDAQALYRAGEKRLGTNESVFQSILATQNPWQLNLVFNEYQRLTGHAIEKAIISEFSSDIRDAYLALIRNIRDRPGYFAEKLHKSMKGMGTCDEDLIRLIVTRCEVDLKDIAAVYPVYGKKSLERAIIGDTSGSYRDALLTLVRGNTC